MGYSDNRSARIARRLSLESRIAIGSFYCILPGLIVATIFLFLYAETLEIWITTYIVILLPFPFIVWRQIQRIVTPLRVASSIISGIREGDYSLRGRLLFDDSGPANELYREVNELIDLLEGIRISNVETKYAIEKIMENIDVAAFVINSNRTVVQANDAAKRLSGSIANWDTAPVGKAIDKLGIQLPSGAAIADGKRFSLKDGPRRFEGRRGAFRMDGKRFELVVLTDISKAASEQERDSWKRLLRVLGHELNNSIAPISSLSKTLLRIAKEADIEKEAKEDLVEGLGAVASRSESIIGFMREYTRLAKLPEPTLVACSLKPLVAKASQLYGNRIQLESTSEDCRAQVDPAQFEQALINLMENAVQASGTTDGGVRCITKIEGDWVEIAIEDDGPGIANTENLFVPFYSTKEKGSGIGLVLSKQIVEAAGGQLSLSNREGRSGCVARIRLPLLED